MTAVTASSPWHRLRHTLRTLGLVNGPMYLLDRFFSRATGSRVRLVKYRVVAQPVGGASAESIRAGGSSAVEDAAPGHPLAAMFPRPAAVIAKRHANGARCLVATVKAQFAGYLWWQRGHYDEDEVRCRYVLAQPAESAWDFDVYVEPRYRLGRTLAVLWQGADQRMHSKGVRWTFSRISSFHADSLASHARLGAVTVAPARFWATGRVQPELFGQPPYAHLSVRGATCPLLQVAPPCIRPVAFVAR